MDGFAGTVSSVYTEKGAAAAPCVEMNEGMDAHGTAAGMAATTPGPAARDKRALAWVACAAAGVCGRKGDL